MNIKFYNHAIFNPTLTYCNISIIYSRILALSTNVFNSKGHIIRLPCLKFANFSIIKNNTELLGSTVATLYGVDETSCKAECLHNERCKSININKEEMICQINGKVAEDLHDGIELVTTEGWTYKSTDYQSNLVSINKHRKEDSSGLQFPSTGQKSIFEQFSLKDNEN